MFNQILTLSLTHLTFRLIQYLTANYITADFFIYYNIEGSLI
jgi:hypothetical protein